jgi:hypothetical protein
VHGIDQSGANERRDGPELPAGGAHLFAPIHLTSQGPRLSRQSPMSLAYYLIALSALSLIGVFMLKDHTGEPLE